MRTRGWYTKKLEELAKEFAKQRDGYTCQYSGEKVSGSNAHGSHVIPKSKGLRWRWDLANIKCLSYHNHINWWHKNPIEAFRWFVLKFTDRALYLESHIAETVEMSTSQIHDFYMEAKQCETWKEYEDCFMKHVVPCVHRPGEIK